jgi:hypothetical protein
MNGNCVLDLHNECPDSIKDSYLCSCPCHIERD